MVAWLLPGAVFAAGAFVDLNVNEASRAQLEQLPGVGVRLADRIIVERDARPFTDWADFRARIAVPQGRIDRWRHDGVVLRPVPASPVNSGEQPLK
jgi:DNA uptake protein ComE-like DNA-binding protein